MSTFSVGNLVFFLFKIENISPTQNISVLIFFKITLSKQCKLTHQNKVASVILLVNFSIPQIDPFNLQFGRYDKGHTFHSIYFTYNILSLEITTTSVNKTYETNKSNIPIDPAYSHHINIRILMQSQKSATETKYSIYSGR